MKRKGMFGWILAAGLLLTACGAEGNNTAESVAPSAAEESFRIGIVQLAQHPALDAATKGFRDELVAEFGDRVSFDEQNASGEVANVSTIVNDLVSKNVDLILANATAPLQTAAAATSEIPILGTSITDYATALELTDFSGTVGTNVSGTTDLSPLDRQADMFQEWFPNAKNVGIIFSSSEANSIFQVQEMTKLLEERGYTVKPFSFTDSNDLQAVVTQAVAESDVIYEPTDNVASSNAEAIGNIVLPAKIPVITGEAEPAKVFGVATLSIDYHELGVETGKMAGRILRGETKIEEMPIQSAPNVRKLVNEKNAKALGLTIPEGYEVLEGTESR